jgi:hypothetical protein
MIDCEHIRGAATRKEYDFERCRDALQNRDIQL